MNVDVLKSHGIDYDAGVERFMGEKEMYETVLVAFLDEQALTNATKFFNEKDYKNLFAVVHDVKGSCGNCDMTDLYRISCILCDLLRDGVYDEKQIALCFDQFDHIYKNTMDGIRKAM